VSDGDVVPAQLADDGHVGPEAAREEMLQVLGPSARRLVEADRHDHDLARER
jgi:hypothetical protein